LKLLIAKLRRLQFGRKSEKLERQIEQLELRLDELQASQAKNAASSQKSAAGTTAVHAAAKPVRRSLPEHLLREVRTIGCTNAIVVSRSECRYWCVMASIRNCVPISGRELQCITFKPFVFT
jgi:hypothetical protein